MSVRLSLRLFVLFNHGTDINQIWMDGFLEPENPLVLTLSWNLPLHLPTRAIDSTIPMLKFSIPAFAFPFRIQ